MYICMYVYIKTCFILKACMMDNILIRNFIFSFFHFLRCSFKLIYTYLATSPFAYSGKNSLTEVTSSIRKNIRYYWMFTKRHYLTLLKTSSSTRYFYYFLWWTKFKKISVQEHTKLLQFTHGTGLSSKSLKK